ncbi:mechanosensitive ion channel family protein [Conchiformibius kuhniae]|uniref:Mechanosensitive ion channel family protein n=1 Tax=Conchiformibius kuhniae TaxID=211502 RepID=A0ABD8B774_9NEIS|nr:mechanosensitive ion channel domain-containing protein [Conchiformibius kuhniae]
MNDFSQFFNDFSQDLTAGHGFTAPMLAQSLKTPAGWVELLLTLAVGWLCLYIAEHDLVRKRIQSWRWHPVRHIAERIFWPLLMFAAASLIQLAAKMAAYPVVWPQLLAMAANWMLGIRLVLAVLHLALPAGRFTVQWERRLSGLLWGCFLLWVSGIDKIITDWMKSLSFAVGSNKLSLYTVLTGLLWVGIVMMLMMWLARWIDEQLMNTRRLDMNLRIVLSKVVKTLFMVLSVLIALPLVGIDLTVLSVFGGALGVGLGFGLQKIASNYVSGFIILADRSVRPGDRLNVNGFTGYVSKITSRFVVLRSIDGQEALIPNETFVTSTVINESYTGKALWQSLDVQVAYETDVPKALAILIESAAAQARVAKNPAPNAFLTGFGDNGIDLRVGFWVDDPENGFMGLFSDIMLTVWRRFNEEGIEFPFPQREVRILNESLPAIEGAADNAPSADVPPSA